MARIEEVKKGEFWSINDAKTRGHPGRVVGKRKTGIVEHIPVTHSPKTRKKRNIPLNENPRKNDSRSSYAVPKVQKTNVKHLGTKQTDMVIKNPSDKAIMRNIKKRSRKKKK